MFLTMLAANVYSQDVKFDKSSLRIDEPVKDGLEETKSFTILLLAEKIPDGATIPVTIEKISGSKWPDTKFKLQTPSISKLVAKNEIKVEITTDPYSDVDSYILLTANFKTDKETVQIKDTLYIKNKYPFKSASEGDYTEWNDGKRAEIFIGSNFDFINSKVTLSDWYGGARVFLPAITDLRFKNDKSSRVPRFGFAGGLYHAKSLSNFGNPNLDSSQRVLFSRPTGIMGDSTFVRYDTMNLTTKSELNNWGLYISPIYQWSRYVSDDGKFITNIYVGAHLEVIRRNNLITYAFDSIGTYTTSFHNTERPRAFNTPPKNQIQTFYDAYFGVCLPIQFLWKDVLDIKVNPCIGVGSRGYSSQVITRGQQTVLKSSPMFYLVQFDLLARLGGLRLNIGGEVRGYFPNERPIITAYLGTSFSIQKLVDFVTK